MAEEVFTSLRWKKGVLYLLDQHRLPGEEIWVSCTNAADAGRAIRDMLVRGAPAIGITAAYGVALAARRLLEKTPAITPIDFRAELGAVSDELASTRPTAVNLFWALAQMRNTLLVALDSDGVEGAVAALEARACAIQSEDIVRCQRMGALGAELIPDDATVLTHCNAGGIATGGYGTALGVIRAARAAGKRIRLYADETRPFLQGVRLTAWEMMREGFDVTIIPDSAAAFLLHRGEITCVIVGADRIAANGDVANKIGTYGVALAAHANGVPFYVAAPTSTIDPETATGAQIPIEERAGSELLTFGDTQIAPRDAVARYPAFDITPNALVSAIITEVSIARAPYTQTLAESLEVE